MSYSPHCDASRPGSVDVHQQNIVFIKAYLEEIKNNWGDSLVFHGDSDAVYAKPKDKPSKIVEDYSLYQAEANACKRPY